LEANYNMLMGSCGGLRGNPKPRRCVSKVLISIGASNAPAATGRGNEIFLAWKEYPAITNYGFLDIAMDHFPGKLLFLGSEVRRDPELGMSTDELFWVGVELAATMAFGYQRWDSLMYTRVALALVLR
jgi:hypothetical protein